MYFLFTIELKMLSNGNERGGNLMTGLFGCDILSDVCPWNKFFKPHSEPLFNANPDLVSMTRTGEEISRKHLECLRFASKRTKFRAKTQY
jgi:epoxyqueuosine reductase